MIELLLVAAVIVGALGGVRLGITIERLRWKDQLAAEANDRKQWRPTQEQIAEAGRKAMRSMREHEAAEVATRWVKIQPTSVPAEWLAPGAVVPVTPETVQLLIEALRTRTN